MLPCPGYYKQCCDEHWGTCVSFNSGFFSVYAQQWDCWVYGSSISSFSRNLHITSWEIDGETVSDFILGGSKITADGDCSHEMKRRFLLGKVMINLDSLLKSRDTTLPTNVHLVKAIVFPVVMYGCESWTVKKARRQRIDAFELWC